jgi:dUTP pyrophosphatase
MASSTSASKPAQAPPPPLSAAPPLLVKKLSDKAKAPTRGSAFAAGYDIYSAKDCTIPKRGKGLVDTDISIAVGGGCCQSLYFNWDSGATEWSKEYLLT